MIPFTGETMKCIMCGKEQRSDPGVESNWRAMTMGGNRRYYACPDEFPADDAGKEAFKAAYMRVIHVVIYETIKENCEWLDSLFNKTSHLAGFDIFGEPLRTRFVEHTELGWKLKDNWRQELEKFRNEDALPLQQTTS